MKKKGDAELIAIILLIVIVIIIISAFIYFYFNYLGKTGEMITLKDKLNNADIKVKDVTIIDSQNLIITFYSGQGFQELIDESREEMNYTYVNVTKIANTTITEDVISSAVNISVMSVVDLSNSMRPRPWIPENKIGELKDASRPFINIILNYTGNEIGLIAYSTGYEEDYSHGFSKNNDSLISMVNTWTNNGGTCICCGINEAIEYSDDAQEGSYKVMIVMSDGQALIPCSRPWPQNAELAGSEAIESARNAFENHNITVNTIGFGADVDVENLEAIAEAGNGTYYPADLGELEEVYKNLSESLIIYTEYNQTVYNYTNITVYENVTTVVYVTRDDFYLKVVFYAGESSYIQNKALSDFPGPAEEKEITFSLDPSWGITTDDLTKIEIYSVIEIEEGNEIISDFPIEVWEPEGEY